MKPPQLSEKQIQETCTRFLELDSWRVLRTDPVSRREWGKGFGEPGMADCLYMRYYNQRGDHTATEAEQRVRAQLMWIEWKRERGGNGKRALSTRAEKAKTHQRAWHAAERTRGALTLIAGEDFPANIEGFEKWYRESGLQRKKVTMGAVGK